MIIIFKYIHTMSFSEAVKAKVKYEGNILIIVTGFEKTLRMGFFVNIVFNVYLISSTIELTICQVWDRLHA